MFPSIIFYKYFLIIPVSYSIVQNKVNHEVVIFFQRRSCTPDPDGNRPRDGKGREENVRWTRGGQNENACCTAFRRASRLRAAVPPFGKETLGTKGAGPNGRVGKILIWVPTNGEAACPAMKNLPKGKGRRSNVGFCSQICPRCVLRSATAVRDSQGCKGARVEDSRDVTAFGAPRHRRFDSQGGHAPLPASKVPGKVPCDRVCRLRPDNRLGNAWRAATSLGADDRNDKKERLNEGFVDSR